MPRYKSRKKAVIPDQALRNLATQRVFEAEQAAFDGYCETARDFAAEAIGVARKIKHPMARRLIMRARLVGKKCPVGSKNVDFWRDDD